MSSAMMADQAQIRASLDGSLISESTGKDGSAAVVFRTVAATVTLLQQREQGEVPIGEGMALALA